MAAMILGGTLAEEAQMDPESAAGLVVFPLFVHCMDIVVSTIGTMLVRTRPGFPDEKYGAPEDCLGIMKRAFLVTVVRFLVSQIIQIFAKRFR